MMSNDLFGANETEDNSSFEMKHNGTNVKGMLLPISENLDADDESDSSDLDSENDFHENTAPKRKNSISLNQFIYKNKAKQPNRRRKTSCIEIFSSSKQDAINSSYKSNCSLPAITRSMSLPESFDNYELKKIPQGSRSATERLQLPNIAHQRESESLAERKFNAKKKLLYLPNIVKNSGQNGSFELPSRNNTEARKLDIFMKNKFS